MVHPILRPFPRLLDWDVRTDPSTARRELDASPTDPQHLQWRMQPASIPSSDRILIYTDLGSDGPPAVAEPSDPTSRVVTVNDVLFAVWRAIQHLLPEAGANMILDAHKRELGNHERQNQRPGLDRAAGWRWTGLAPAWQGKGEWRLILR